MRSILPARAFVGLLAHRIVIFWIFPSGANNISSDSQVLGTIWPGKIPRILRLRFSGQIVVQALRDTIDIPGKPRKYIDHTFFPNNI